jgi:hypothetical protein
MPTYAKLSRHVRIMYGFTFLSAPIIRPQLVVVGVPSAAVLIWSTMA